MRLREDDVATIRRTVQEEVGADANVCLFGSRLDDNARGGDIDLLVRSPHPIAEPAMTAARISSRLIRAFHGRRVDVVLSAPNLRHLPIHEAAERSGVLL